MKAATVEEIYEGILQSLLELKRELERAGETRKREAEAVGEIVVSLKALELQDSSVGG